MTTHPICPRCAQVIDANGVNVAKNVAHCSRCNELWSVTDITQIEESHQVLARGRPSGAFDREAPSGWVVGATMRRIGLAMNFMIPGVVFMGVIVLGMVPVGFAVIFGPLGVAFMLLAILLICGRVEVVRTSNGCEVFSGIGPIGWRRRFDPESARSIVIAETTTNVNGKTTHEIVIDAGTRVRLGHWLTMRRKQWVAAELRRRFIF